MWCGGNSPWWNCRLPPGTVVRLAMYVGWSPICVPCLLWCDDDNAAPTPVYLTDVLSTESVVIYMSSSNCRTVQWTHRLQVWPIAGLIVSGSSLIFAMRCGQGGVMPAPRASIRLTDIYRTFNLPIDGFVCETCFHSGISRTTDCYARVTCGLTTASNKRLYKTPKCHVYV